LDQLIAALKALHSHAFGPKFNIHAPGPLQSQIINALITNIVPDFWPSLEVKHGQELILCLSNVAGFNAILARLKFFDSENGSEQTGERQSVAAVECHLDVVKSLFKGNNVISLVFTNLLLSVPQKPRRDMIWKDFVNLLGSGKVIATVAQALDHSKTNQKSTGVDQSVMWLANGSEYSTWLGLNMEHMLFKGLDESPDHVTSAVAQLLAKTLSLGYSKSIMQGLFGQIVPDLISKKLKQDSVLAMVKHIPLYATRTFMEHLLRWMSGLSFTDTETTRASTEKTRQTASALAALVSLIATADRHLQDNLLLMLSDPPFASSLSLSTRRACLATISSPATTSDDFQSLLEKLMTTFNDAVFANHAPILQQESLAQMLLIAAGYVHRQTPMALLMTARSSNHMQGVSHRLDSSNAKARWLGMVVGTALSSLVDKDGAKMNFGTDDMQTEDAQWYLQLVYVNDNVGTLKDFNGLLQTQGQLKQLSKRDKKVPTPEEMPKLNGKPLFGPPRPPVQTEVIGEKVTEVLDSDDEVDDDDLKPCAKPDSDPEDSDDDATLVNRDKARPPVYVRDLMAMLRDDKNHDRFQLGLKHAASLIRRKSNFGAEVKDHAEEIGVILCNLQDPFSTEDFSELKLQALIAVLISDVKVMAPWLCKQAFLGDYSIAQRCAMLSAIGLGGRELAGLKNEDDLNPTQRYTEFASKRLPSHLHSIYHIDKSSTKRLETASNDIEQALIKPLALQAADQSTANLNAVKVRTFSSRMEVERTKRMPAQNALAKVFGEAFFFALANRYQQEIAAYSTSSVYSSVPFLLVTFLKTLALLLHASGPATAALTEISGEFWDLLLSLRVTALSDISVLQAVLFSLLTLLEVNADKRRIVQEHPKQLMETQQWVDMVFERIGAGSARRESSDEAKVQTLAAGVLVKTREVIEAYQKELIGFGIE
jgi:telomere length regulation protein